MWEWMTGYCAKSPAAGVKGRETLRSHKVIFRVERWIETVGRAPAVHALNEGLFEDTVGRLTDAKLAEILAAVRALF